MAGTTKDPMYQATSGGALGFGVLALLAPGLLARIYGFKAGGDMKWVLRMWGTRTAVLGGALLLSEPEDLQRNLSIGAVAMNAVDALNALRAGEAVKFSTRLRAALTSATFAGLIASTLRSRAA